MKALYAVDLGTTKFCIARFISMDDGKHKFETIAIEAKGMRRGMIADFSQAKTQLLQLIDEAESKFGSPVRKTVVGIAGNHLKGDLNTTQMSITGQIITEKHMKSLAEQNVPLGDTRESLHKIALSYRVDGREWIKNPVGFSGHNLSCEVFNISAEKSYLIDIIRLFNSIGVQVDALYAEPYASSLVTVDIKDREQGIAVADIGGGTTDGIVFKNGLPIGLFSIAIAGKLFTSDLEIVLGVEKTRAELLKKKYGLFDFSDDCATFNATSEEAKKVSDVLKARADELIFHLDRSLNKYRKYIPNGLILTGGSCQLKGLPERMGTRTQMGVKRLYPNLPSSQTFLVDSNSSKNNESNSLSYRYATISGLMYLYLLEKHSELSDNSKNSAMSYLKFFWNWVKELG